MTNESRHALTILRSKLLEALDKASNVAETEKLAIKLLEIDTRLKRKPRRPQTGQEQKPPDDAGGLLD